jgi:hypothetical protein
LIEIRAGFWADLKLNSNRLFVRKTTPKSIKGQFEKTVGLALGYSRTKGFKPHRAVDLGADHNTQRGILDLSKIRIEPT